MFEGRLPDSEPWTDRVFVDHLNDPDPESGMTLHSDLLVAKILPAVPLR